VRKGDVLVVLEAMKLEVGIALFSSPLNCPPACLAAYTLYLPPRPFGRHHTAAPAAGGCKLTCCPECTPTHAPRPRLPGIAPTAGTHGWRCGAGHRAGGLTGGRGERSCGAGGRGGGDSSQRIKFVVGTS